VKDQFPMDHIHRAFPSAHKARRLSTKRTLPAAFHEPGHALEHVYYGGQIVEVMIRSEYELADCGTDYIDTDGMNNAGVGLGACIGPALFNPASDYLGVSGWHIRAEMQMIVLMGGVYPLQRRFRWSSATAAIAAGKDYAQAERIADLLGDRQSAFNTAEQFARALVRSASGWKFICVVAERLIDQGLVLGNECNEIFASCFGRAPVDTADWDAHWPPTLEQLQAGWLPPCR
jgi:hypothetical protein